MKWSEVRRLRPDPSLDMPKKIESSANQNISKKKTKILGAGLLQLMISSRVNRAYALVIVRFLLLSREL